MDQSPEERRDALFERIEELTGREFPRNQFPQQSDKYPDEANEAIRSMSDVLGAISSRNRGKCSRRCHCKISRDSNHASHRR